MNKTFAEQWKMYKEGGKRPQFTGEKPRGEAEFDTPVKVGEIRIFADMARPFVALVAEERGVAGWLLVPVSPFSVPASSREVLEGERVYQLWNACTASRSFVARSWRVDEISKDEMLALNQTIKQSKQSNNLSIAADGIVAEYEREFLVSGGDFIPLVDKCEPSVVHVSWRKVWGIAACFVVLLGIGVVTLRDTTLGERPTVSKDYMITRAAAPDVVEPPPEEVKSIESEDEDIDFAPDLVMEQAPVAERAVPAAKAMAPMPPARMEPAALIRSPVKMKSMVGSRTPRSVCADPPRPWNDNGRSASPDSEAMKRRRHLESNVPWNDHAGANVVSGSIKERWEAEVQPIGSERYAEIQENDYRDPTSEPLSTFGLDVDTSSYTTMRRYIDEMKRVPPKESVRLEEWINYFKYSYPQPKGDEPIAVACEMGICPWAPKHKLLRVGVQAKEVAADKIPPCNLTFLIDVSGSMGCNGGFEMMKAGLNMLVDKLRPEDHVAIVTYAAGTEVRLASTPGTEKAKIRTAIEALRTGDHSSNQRCRNAQYIFIR